MVTGRIAAIATVSDMAEYRYLYQQAQFFAIEGRSNAALYKLRAWLDYGVEIFTYIKWDPFLESLRGNPRFEAIVTEVETQLADTRMQYLALQAGTDEAGSQ